MTKEWDMVQELFDIVEEVNSLEAQQFITDLYENLDPNMPFLEQQSGRQEAWLYGLFEQYINGDYETAKEYFSEL